MPDPEARASLRAQLPAWLEHAEVEAIDLAREDCVWLRRPHDGRRFVLNRQVHLLLLDLLDAPLEGYDAILAGRGLEPDRATYTRLGAMLLRLEDRRPRLDQPGFVWKHALLSSERTVAAARRVGWLLDGRIALPVVVGLLVLDPWLLLHLDVTELGLGVAGVTLPLLLLSAVFHELGHAAALLRGGGRPGAIGFGFYLIWPVMYADTTESWRLPRRQRMLVDASGVYFQLVSGVLIGLLGLLTGSGELRLASIVVQLATLVNFNPLFRYDGHWLLTDWLGVTNLYVDGRRSWSASAPAGRSRRDTVVLRGFWAVVVVFWPVVLGGALISFFWQSVVLVRAGATGGSGVPMAELVPYALTAVALLLASYKVVVLARARRRHDRAEPPTAAGTADHSGTSDRRGAVA